MNSNKSLRKSLYWLVFFLAMLVAPMLACDENDVRDTATDAYYTQPISAQCSDNNIWGAKGQCK